VEEHKDKSEGQENLEMNDNSVKEDVHTNNNKDNALGNIQSK